MLRFWRLESERQCGWPRLFGRRLEGKFGKGGSQKCRVGMVAALCFLGDASRSTRLLCRLEARLMFGEAGFGSAESSEPQALATFPTKGVRTSNGRKAGATKATVPSCRISCAELNPVGCAAWMPALLGSATPLPALERAGFRAAFRAPTRAAVP